MQTRVGFSDSPMNDGIQRELVAPRMNAQLQIGGEIEGLDRKAEHRQVILKFSAELFAVTDIIDPFEERPRELRGNGLERYLLLRGRGKDEEQFYRRLGGTGLINGNLGNDVVGAFAIDDRPIDF